MILKYFSCLILTLGLLRQMYAQIPSSSIKGIVKDSQNKPLNETTVVLSNAADTSFLQTKASDANGAFVFVRLQPGTYSLLVSHTGFLKNSIACITVDAMHTGIALPVIVLSSATGTDLKEVLVVSKKPIVEQKIDRTIVNVDAIFSAAGSSAMDVLSKAPGVSISAGDVISLNGKNNVLVLIDDRAIYMSGAGLVAYLRSLPGSLLDKLELISNPPARYDANGNAVINLVLKKDRTAGFNGAVNIGYNQGVYARFNNAVNINYRRARFNIFGNIGYSRDKDFSDQTYRRYFYHTDGSPAASVLQNSGSTYASHGWNGRLGMDYFISPSTTMSIVLTGSIRPRTDLLAYTSDQYNAGMQLDSVATGYTSGVYKWTNAGVNLNAQQAFGKKGKAITISADQVNYHATGDQFAPAAVYLPDGSLYSNAQRAFHFPSDIHIHSGKLEYTHPLDNKTGISGGIKSSYVVTDNQSNWFDQQGNALVSDYNKSNHFRYAENISSAFINGKKEWARWAVQAGIRVEHTYATGNQFANPLTSDTLFAKHYTNVFPSLYLLYKLDSPGSHTLVVSYSKRIRRPSYQQLNPFIFFQDVYTYTTGNPNLSASFAQYVELRYNYKQYAGVTVSYGGGNNGINNVTQPNGTAFVTRPLNYIDSRLVGIVPYCSFAPTKWWTFNLNAVILFQSINGAATGVSIHQRVNTHEIETNHQFRLSNTISAELTGFFPGRQTFGQNKSDAIYNISCGLQKKVLKGQGTVRLNANDIFHSLNVNSQTIGILNTNAFSTRSTDSRWMGVSFSYRFGKTANARKHNDNSSAEEEKARTVN